MSASQVTSPLFGLRQERELDSDSGSAWPGALAGQWYVIAASQGSIGRNPQNVTETFDVSGTRIASSLRFERLSGSAASTRRRVFDTSPNDNLISLLRTSLDVVLVEDDQAVVAEGPRLRILSRTPDIAPRDFFRLVSLSREKGHDADNLRMIPTRRD